MFTDTNSTSTNSDSLQSSNESESETHSNNKTQKDKVYEFLTGLNNDFDEVRSRIKSRTPFPRTEAFSEVHRDESRRRVMLQKEEIHNSEKSALIVKPQSTEDSTVALLANRDRFSNDSRGGRRSERPWCDHCQKPGHTKSVCWELHGKPNNWTPNRQGDRKGFQGEHQGYSRDSGFQNTGEAEATLLQHNSETHNL
ncbi:hypothetical protein LIER_00569 [Lithospermum erythrorhizon]|uniref:Uncharacterized protein n=1 Tax=Lithospermum erythrorhizon TaxID=34254 RepID=A0AAV3NMD8_LITER